MPTVSDHLLQRLRAWGVQRIYGYPGDGINGLMGAMQRQSKADDGGIEFIQARHEELAAFMACAHAKFSGEVGVCMATSGPGAIHLLNGLYDAKADHQPLVAIIGQQARAGLGGDFQQEVDLHTLFKDVAGAYVQTVMVPEQLRHVIDRAMRIARDQRAVSCVIVPLDVQALDAVTEPPREHGTVHSGIGITSISSVPGADDLQRAAEVLNAGKKVAMLVGAGALNASAEVIQMTELLGAGVAKALLGKMVVPDDLPFVTGSIGLLGTEPSWTMMNDCDTLLMIGSSFPYGEYLPKEGQARGVQIDLDPARLGLRYPMEVNLAGDAAQTLRALIPLLREKKDRKWRGQIEAGVARWWRVLETRAMNEPAGGQRMNPQRVFWELSPRLPADSIVTCDSGTSASWYARDLKAQRGMMGSVSGGLASMGCAIPYAIAAKFAHPARPVIALLGDGAMQMIGINALVTLAQHWRQWADPRLLVMVLDNGDLNMVTWEQRAMSGDPKFETSQDLPPFAYADYARMLGLNGVRIDKAADIAPAWDAALAADRPTLLQMVVDPNVPPVPPHVPAAQMLHYLKAMLHGDPQAREVIADSAREWWANVKPN